MASMCCYCGRKVPSGCALPSGSCSYSPHKKHEWINADGVKQFICSYCGRKVPSNCGMPTSCSSSPHKTHKWIAG